MFQVSDGANANDRVTGVVAFEGLALVISALNKLEVGLVVVTSFRATMETVRGFDDEQPMSTKDRGP